MSDAEDKAQEAIDTLIDTLKEVSQSEEDYQDLLLFAKEQIQDALSASKNGN